MDGGAPTRRRTDRKTIGVDSLAERLTTPTPADVDLEASWLVAHRTMGGNGGMVHADGAFVADWLVGLVSDPGRADVIQKLDRSGAVEREVFIPVTHQGAPWSVISYLTDIDKDDDVQLPAASLERSIVVNVRDNVSE